MKRKEGGEWMGRGGGRGLAGVKARQVLGSRSRAFPKHWTVTVIVPLLLRIQHEHSLHAMPYRSNTSSAVQVKDIEPAVVTAAKGVKVAQVVGGRGYFKLVNGSSHHSLIAKTAPRHRQYQHRH